VLSPKDHLTTDTRQGLEQVSANSRMRALYRVIEANAERSRFNGNSEEIEARFSKWESAVLNRDRDSRKAWSYLQKAPQLIDYEPERLIAYSNQILKCLSISHEQAWYLLVKRPEIVELSLEKITIDFSILKFVSAQRSNTALRNYARMSCSVRNRSFRIYLREIDKNCFGFEDKYEGIQDRFARKLYALNNEQILQGINRMKGFIEMQRDDFRINFKPDLTEELSLLLERELTQWQKCLLVEQTLLEQFSNLTFNALRGLKTKALLEDNPKAVKYAQLLEASLSLSYEEALRLVSSVPKLLERSPQRAAILFSIIEFVKGKRDVSTIDIIISRPSLAVKPMENVFIGEVCRVCFGFEINIERKDDTMASKLAHMDRNEIEKGIARFEFLLRIQSNELKINFRYRFGRELVTALKENTDNPAQFIEMYFRNGFLEASCSAVNNIPKYILSVERPSCRLRERNNYEDYSLEYRISLWEKALKDELGDKRFAWILLHNNHLIEGKPIKIIEKVNTIQAYTGMNKQQCWEIMLAESDIPITSMTTLLQNFVVLKLFNYRYEEIDKGDPYARIMRDYKMLESNTVDVFVSEFLKAGVIPESLVVYTRMKLQETNHISKRQSRINVSRMRDAYLRQEDHFKISLSADFFDRYLEILYDCRKDHNAIKGSLTESFAEANFTIGI
jgi:hypothetical protein